MGRYAAQRFAEAISPTGLHPRMWGALNVLDSTGPITQQALGQIVGIDPSSMVSTIDDLEAAGLVERRADPSDRRKHALHITEKGKQTLTEGRQIARGAQNELLAPLSAEERAQLHDLLLRLAVASQEE
jgi:DNA-binding MarR family transcriptional regulator